MRRSRRPCGTPAPPSSTISMRARSASRRTASGNSRFCVFMRKPNASPPSPQPKQCHSCVAGSTLNDAVFSPWNGHRPQNRRPFWRRGTVSETSATISVASRTRGRHRRRYDPCPPPSTVSRRHAPTLPGTMSGPRERIDATCSFMPAPRRRQPACVATGA